MAAVFEALRFQSGSPARLHSVPDSVHRRLLAFTDRTQLTLSLGQRWPLSQLPGWLSLGITERLEKNELRCTKLLSIYQEIASALDAAGLNHAVLKGFSAVPDFCPDLHSRVQYDIDLLLSRCDAERARDVLIPIGYESLDCSESMPADHLPPLLKKQPWEWKGDYFTLDLPVSVDLHFRLWDERTEAIPVPGLDEFPTRIRSRSLDGLAFRALGRADAVAYAALHMLRHLLRGSLRPAHAWEIAWFLHSTRADHDFWMEWKHLHAPQLRRLQAVCFSLVRRWHDCALASEVQDELTCLPSAVRDWIDEFAWSPITGLHRPNKDELWLNLALIDDPRLRIRILRRRLLPVAVPGHVSAAYLSAHQATRRVMIQAHVERLRYMAGRAAHHFRALISFGGSTVRWKTGLPAAFWRYFAAAAFFDVGLFTFFLLYNIYLLQIGFTERLLGQVSAAMTTGSLFGCLVTALILRRWNVRKTLTVTLVVLTIATVSRAIVTAVPALVALAAVSGAATSVWAVSIAPTVAALCPERSRPRAFSFIFAAGISLGILGGFLGGNLPDLLMQTTSSRTVPLRLALILSCGPVLIAALLLLRLPPVHVGAPARSVFRVNPFVRSYLVAIALWHLGTGSFNPFFNAFFVRLGYDVPRIGSIFSFSQATQTLAVLAAPFVIRNLGLTRGVAATQAATAVFVLCLSLTNNSAVLVAAYAAYMACQFMSEPGMNTLLMGSIAPAQRAGASGLNFAVAFTAQAVAASLAGVLIPELGYAGVLRIAAMLCVAGAAAFYLLGQQAEPFPASAVQDGPETDRPGTPAPTAHERSA